VCNILTVLTANTSETFWAKACELVDTVHARSTIVTRVAQALVMSCKETQHGE